MTTPRALGASLLFVALAGCDCSPPICTVTPPLAPTPARPPGRVGVPYTLALLLPGKTTRCGSGAPTRTFATSVTAELLDPDNQPVPVSVPASPLDPMVSGVAFVFTPKTPGAYHLTARFEPDFDSVQTDLIISVDRPDALVHVLAVPRECARFDRLGDITLCIAPEPDAGALFTVANGQVVASVPAYDFAAAPDLGGVWAIAPGGERTDYVQFHQLSDAGVLTMVGQVLIDDPAPLNEAEGAMSGPPYSIADARLMADGGAALVLLPPLWGFASLDGGSVVFELHSDPTHQLQPGLVAQWPGGEAVEVVGGETLLGAQECRLPLDGGDNCGRAFGAIAGATPDAVWTFDNVVTFSLQGVSLGADGLLTTTHLPLGMPDPLSAWLTPDAAPRWRLDGGVVVLGFDGGTNTVEYFSFDLGDATWFDADARHVWKWSASTQTLSYIDR